MLLAMAAESWHRLTWSAANYNLGKNLARMSAASGAGDDEGILSDGYEDRKEEHVGGATVPIFTVFF